jgi:SAM-dependent methyltransferase
MSEFNAYADAQRAEAYSTLGFSGTYHIAYRDLPDILYRHVRGPDALDLGCGAGRSTRFLQHLGFSAMGADISAEMIRMARKADPAGDYRLVGDVDFSALPGERFDLVLSVFTFDNVPTRGQKHRILLGLSELLNPWGRIVHVVSSPAIYTHEWASFSTRRFPENWLAKDGDIVRTVITDTPDARPVEDVLCSDARYRQIFAAAGFRVEATYRPLARGDEPFRWVNETRIPPWTIYVLALG